MPIMLVVLFLLIMPFVALAAEKEDGALRLDLIRANLYLATNRVEKALTLLDILKKQHPGNADVIAAEADAYLQAGYRHRGFVSLDALSHVMPDDEALSQRKEQAMAVAYPFVSLEQNSRFMGEHTAEYITRLSGGMRYMPRLFMGATLEHNHVKAADISRLNGWWGPFDGINRRAEIYSSYCLENGNQSGASFYLAEGVTGAGLWYNRYDNHGLMDVELQFQRPDWDFIEEVIDRGRKDRATLSRTHIFTPRLRVTASGSINRYGLGNDTNIANSPSFYMDADYLVPPMKAIDLVRHRAALKFDYSIDGEYPFYVEKRMDMYDYPYMPLPLESREVHALTALFSQEVNKDVYYEMFAGYAYDRLGGNGPLFGAFISWWPLKRLGLEMSASQSIYKETTTDSVENIGVKAKWVF